MKEHIAFPHKMLQKKQPVENTFCGTKSPPIDSGLLFTMPKPELTQSNSTGEMQGNKFVVTCRFFKFLFNLSVDSSLL
jgi:hypothetical protein